jgi:hypothetical protein
MKAVMTFGAAGALLLVSQIALAQNTSSLHPRPDFPRASEPAFKVPPICDTKVLNADGAWTSTGQLVASKPYCPTGGASSRAHM